MSYLPRRIFGLIALCGFILSLGVHVSALMGIDVAASFKGVWALHLGIFVVFIPFMLYSWNDFGTRPSLIEIGATLPRWAFILGAIIFVYAVINFMLFIAGTQGGNPAIEDGQYVLLNHGTLIRHLSAEEYAAFQANSVRGFSGHWLVFYFSSFAYLLLSNKSNYAIKGTSA
ncbi:MAG: hypothetical protein ACREO1_01695 [Arenimonas sp.]